MSKEVLGRIGTANRELTLEEVADKVNVAVDIYRRAMQRYKAGRDATEDWEKVIRLLELERGTLLQHEATSRHNLGVVYLKQGNLPKAITHFRKALELNPEYALCARNLSVAYRKAGELPLANEMEATAKRLGWKPKSKNGS